MTIIIAIDPGRQGALSVFLDAELVGIEDLPYEIVHVTKKGKKQYALDLGAFARLVSEVATDVTRIVIEAPAPRPGDGATQSFASGRSFGRMEGVLAAYPTTMVQPREWMDEIGLTVARQAHPSLGPKKVSRVLAADLFPKWADRFARAKDDGRAESALLGKWAIDRLGLR